MVQPSSPLPAKCDTVSGMSAWIRSSRKAAIGYALVVLILFLPVFTAGEGMLIYGDDIHREYYFFRGFFNSWLARGIFPWWNPYIFSGFPFIANPLINIWYPPNWLYTVLPRTAAYPVHLAFHIFWASFGMYLLMKSRPGGGRALSDTASWIAGLIFGFSGFFMARIWAGHVDVIAAASWLPWAVYTNAGCQTPGVEWRKRCVFAGVVFAMQLFAGYQTMAFMSVLVIGAVTMLHSLITKSWKPFLRALPAGFLGVGLAAFHILPVQEFVRQSVRTYAFPYSWISYGAWEWRSLLQFVHPFVFGTVHSYTGPPPNIMEHSAFIGVGGLILAISAIIGVGRYLLTRKATWKTNSTMLIWTGSFTVITFFGIWVSLGPNAPVDLQYVLWKTVPAYKYLRIPTRHLIIVVFGLAGLAGVGFELVSQSRKSLTLFKILMAGAIVLEMLWFGRNFIEVRPVPEARHDQELIRLIVGDSGNQDIKPYRFLQNFGAWLPQRDALDFSAGMEYGIFSATGYDPVMYRPYYEFVARASGKAGEQAILEQDVQVPYLTPAAAETIDFLNIKYVMVPTAYDPFAGNPRYVLARESTEYDYRLYENTTVSRRFFPENPDCGEITVESYTPNEVRLSANLTCSTTIVSSEVMYPGWEVFVDNRKSYIIRTSDVFRSVFVPGGTHTIVYRFRPVIYVYGALITLGTALLCLVLLRFTGKKSHHAST